MQGHNKHQITAEVVLTATDAAHVPDAGTLTVAFKPVGAVATQNCATTIALTGAPATRILEGSFDTLTFTPASLDGDCSFLVKYSGWSD